MQNNLFMTTCTQELLKLQKTILDLAFVTKPDKCFSSPVHSLGLSDHNLIYITLKNKEDIASSYVKFFRHAKCMQGQGQM